MSELTNERDRPPLEEPLAKLERRLIAEYVAAAGHDLEALLARHDDEARKILAEASLSATATLAEVESRSHYLHSLRGEP